jgi:hypothetical protein
MRPLISDYYCLNCLRAKTWWKKATDDWLTFNLHDINMLGFKIVVPYPTRPICWAPCALVLMHLAQHNTLKNISNFFLHACLVRSLWCQSLPALLNTSEFVLYIVHVETLTNTRAPYHIPCILTALSYITLMQNGCDNSLCKTEVVNDC